MNNGNVVVEVRPNVVILVEVDFFHFKLGFVFVSNIQGIVTHANLVHLRDIRAL